MAGRAARGGRGGERTPSPGREEAPEAGEAEDEGETGGGQKDEVVDGGEEESGEAETDGARTEAASRERETGARGGGGTEAAEHGAEAGAATRGRVRVRGQTTSSRTFGEMWRATD